VTAYQRHVRVTLGNGHPARLGDVGLGPGPDFGCASQSLQNAVIWDRGIGANHMGRHTSANAIVAAAATLPPVQSAVRVTISLSIYVRADEVIE
jgi:hypothetical protein